MSGKGYVICLRTAEDAKRSQMVIRGMAFLWRLRVKLMNTAELDTVQNANYPQFFLHLLATKLSG